jgi:enoyl-CoA hydratase/carnithine racemase
MDTIRYEKEGALGIVTLTNPPMNLIDMEMVDGISDAVERAENDGLRGLLMKNDEAHFCVGADVKLFLGLSPKEADPIFRQFLGIINRVEKLPFPTMAAVNGMCLAGGLEIALAFDLIWAGQTAMFGQAEAMIGAIPFGGGAQRLAARAGTARTKEIVFGARLYPAADFERWNIINRVLPDAEVVEKAKKYMGALANNGATRALAAVKEILAEFSEETVREADEKTLKLSARMFETEDLRAGVESFLKEGPGKAKFSGK